MSSRPRVLLLRGHHVNAWDLRPWELLKDTYDIAVLLTGSNLYQAAGLGIDVREVRTPRDLIPGQGRLTGAAAYALGERYLGLAEHLRDTDIVHAAELGTWFAAQAARLRARFGYRLVVTVWETIPWGDAYRWPRERRYRRAVLRAADLFLPATERARAALLLEGVAPDRQALCPPGIDLERFGKSGGGLPPRDVDLVLSAGRLVWEKGHQDVLRAVAAARRGLFGPPRPALRLAIVGSGPEESRLRRYAAELGLGDAVEFLATVPYDAMPGVFARAGCMVLASLPTRGWEEQFGMVLVEALAAGTPVIAYRTGAIHEVVDDAATLVPTGDWIELARALTHPAQARNLVQLDRYSSQALATRLRKVYARLLT